MENLLNNYSNMEDDISVSSSDDEVPNNLIDLINNHPDIPLDFEEMEDYIEDMVELYELQYQGRPNDSGDPPNALVIRHLVEQERNALLDLADDVNDFHNQFLDIPIEYHQSTSDGDMPQDLLEEEDIQILNTVNILVAKKVRPIKTRYKTTRRASIDNLRKPMKNSIRSEISLRTNLLTYRRQSDVYIRRYSHQ